MALVHASRVQETSTTTGTGPYTLAGAVGGFQSFAVIGNGNTCYYEATDGTNWEEGIGTYASSGTTLTRTTILASSNGGAAVSWSAGTRNIFVTIPASKFIGKDDVTPWVAYTPTFTGFGTVTGISMWSRRVGDTLHVRGYFTTGTCTNTEARISLGFNGTDGNVSSDATKVPALQAAGILIMNAVGAYTANMLIESNVAYMTISAQNASLASLTKVNASAFFTNATKCSILATIPISGW